MLHVEGLYLRRGSNEVLHDIHLQLPPGQVVGVLGPNGSGKSTLLKIMAGIEKDFNGEAWAMEGTKIGYLEQELGSALPAMRAIKASLDPDNIFNPGKIFRL